MNFFKILKGKEATASEVLSEIKSLKATQAEKQGYLATLEDNQHGAWLDSQSGGSDKGFRAAQEEIAGLKLDIDMLEKTLQDLGSIYGSCQIKEKQTRKIELQKQIETENHRLKALRVQWLGAQAVADALRSFLPSDCMLRTGDENEASYDPFFKKTLAGVGLSPMAQIQALHAEMQVLK